MAFRQLEIERGSDFNSAVSSNFKAYYDKLVVDEIEKESSRIPSKTFAPSSFRCDRLSYFRLRGVEPDKEAEKDVTLEFTANIGTACHEIIQKRLSESLKDNWIEVSTYLEENPVPYQYKVTKDSKYETKVEFLDPPVRFAVDGIVKFGDEYYLLEIKTSEYNSFKALSEPKPNHIDQVKCYCSLLNIDKALVFYLDRQYGATKCFEVHVPDYEKEEVFKKMEHVLQCIKDNIAPARLPQGDYWCSYCKYKKRCEQWG